jgi:hypothetical protein
MPINPPNSTLTAIQQKVRRLTRSPSQSQLTDDDLNNYINTFVVYDFPEQLRTFQLRRPFKFWCNPFQDVYPTDTSWPVDNPLYNFQNKYISVHPPVYVAGYQAVYTQSRNELFLAYPFVNSISSIGQVGDGVTTTFMGSIQNSNGAPALQGQVLFDSISTTNGGLALVDIANVPFDGNGILVVPGTTAPLGAINYITGAFNFTFPAAPAAGAPINSQAYIYQPAIPMAMLYYNDQFTLRPVPDQPYQINFEVYARPTYLMAEDATPELEEQWQYIAYGAAKKIFEDRMDMDSVGLIMQEFKTQERLCLRRTIVQNTNERVATIYTDSTGWGYGGWGYGTGQF